MPNVRIAARYAKSIVDLAVEQNQLEAVCNDMKYLLQLCKSSREFHQLLRSPIIKGDTKHKIFLSVTENNIGALVKVFVQLLIRKGREANLAEIAAAFVEQYNAIKGIHHVKLTTAAPLSDSLQQEIKEKVKAAANLPEVELETSVKEEIIGGFMLEYDGNLIDASIQRDLRDIRRQFMENTFVRNIR